jgi:hypothetical protein
MDSGSTLPQESSSDLKTHQKPESHEIATVHEAGISGDAAIAGAASPTGVGASAMASGTEAVRPSDEEIVSYENMIK